MELSDDSDILQQGPGPEHPLILTNLNFNTIPVT